MSASIPPVPPQVGVALLNLGGPSSLEEIRPFLLRLFSDPDVFDLPLKPLLLPLFAWVMAMLRAPRVAPNYARIGGGSPILAHTRAQAGGLVAELAARGVPARVEVGMRYTPPFIQQAVQRLAAARVESLVLLPLFPQYCRATTRSALQAARRAVGPLGEAAPAQVREVRSFPENAAYLGALDETVAEALARFPSSNGPVPVVLSAHGVPKSLVRGGDPYVREVERTAQGLASRLPPGTLWRLGYQSRVGPVRWIRPTTHEVLVALRQQGHRSVCLVPLTFVSDHIETLYDLDYLYPRQARALGFERYERAPALNDRPSFVRALADLVQKALA